MTSVNGWGGLLAWLWVWACTGGDLQVIAAGSGVCGSGTGAATGPPSVPYTMSGSAGV
ncbi:hypothetical protein GCM10010446_45530 [Streptomyces enissocaesilis]|uniref:Uncharacterized protein n=1 Tax=Streptomyces enissocaesilis TaxID=332589 RepID=A0ABP6JYF6_9ACTN